MAYSHSKPDSKLVEGPVEELCGNPAKRTSPGTTDEVYGLEGPTRGGEMDKFNMIREGIAPHTSADQPSDAKQFQGQSEV